jgi:hypothetical protein
LLPGSDCTIGAVTFELLPLYVSCPMPNFSVPISQRRKADRSARRLAIKHAGHAWHGGFADRRRPGEFDRRQRVHRPDQRSASDQAGKLVEAGIVLIALALTNCKFSRERSAQIEARGGFDAHAVGVALIAETVDRKIGLTTSDSTNGFTPGSVS